MVMHASLAAEGQPVTVLFDAIGGVLTGGGHRQ
jgi:hypothetical protein